MGTAAQATGTAITVHREHVGTAPSPAVTARTVEIMGDHIRAALHDSEVQKVARSIEQKFAPADALAAAWWWAKQHVHFLHHDPQICRLLNQCDGGDYQLLVTPPVLVRMGRPEGDCATFTMLVDALAALLGYQVRIVTLACDRQRPGEYTHVYGSAYLPDAGLWCPLDASHGDAPGWEVPSYDVQRRTEWDLHGRMLSDQTFSRPAPPKVAGGSASAGVGSYLAGLGLVAPPPAEALAAAQAAYDARAARCMKYTHKEYVVAIGAGVLVAVLLPGLWKLLAVPAGIATAVAFPRSPDCDYGF